MRLPAGAALALLALAGQAAPLAAQEQLPKFYVYGEDDGTRELTECKASHASAIGAVQAELRGAGVTIQANADDPEAVMDVYINVSPMPVAGAITPMWRWWECGGEQLCAEQSSPNLSHYSSSAADLIIQVGARRLSVPRAEFLTAARGPWR